MAAKMRASWRACPHLAARAAAADEQRVCIAGMCMREWLGHWTLRSCMIEQGKVGFGCSVSAYEVCRRKGERTMHDVTWVAGSIEC
jgi:hypothetical protein